MTDQGEAKIDSAFIDRLSEWLQCGPIRIELQRHEEGMVVAIITQTADGRQRTYLSSDSPDWSQSPDQMRSAYLAALDSEAL